MRLRSGTCKGEKVCGSTREVGWHFAMTQLQFDEAGGLLNCHLL